MKRFTETGKWEDVWYRKLSPSAKLLWGWITDKCDAAGIIEIDFELATFQIGMTINEGTLEELASRIEHLQCGKVFITGFVSFQVGIPSRECKAHNPIFMSLQKHQVERVLEGYSKGIHTPQEKETDKDKEKEMDGKGVEGEGAPINGCVAPTLEEAIAYTLSCGVIIPGDCVADWHDDRTRAKWHYPKGGKLFPLTGGAAVWQADLRGFARIWKRNDDERRSSRPPPGTYRKPPTTPKDPTRPRTF